MGERNLRKELDNNNIWHDDILKFPRIQSYLRNEVVRQKNLYGSLVNDVKARKQIDTDQKIKHYDREINLNRVLNRNAKYRGIGRNKPPLSNFLEPILVASIRHNPTKSISKITIEKLSRSRKPCPKYIKRMREFDENEFRRVFSLGAETEQPEELTLAIPIEDLPADPNVSNTQNQENITNEDNSEIDPTLEASVNIESILTSDPLPSIKEEPEFFQSKKKLEKEIEIETPRVQTPATPDIEDNLPSFSGEDPFGNFETSEEITKLNREPSMNFIVPKMQAAQVKHLNKK